MYEAKLLISTPSAPAVGFGLSLSPAGGVGWGGGDACLVAKGFNCSENLKALERFRLDLTSTKEHSKQNTTKQKNKTGQCHSMTNPTAKNPYLTLAGERLEE